MAIFMVITSATFVSCGSDDDDDTPAAGVVTTKFNGKITPSVAKMDIQYNPIAVGATATNNDNKTIDIEIDRFESPTTGGNSITFEAFSVKGAKVTSNSNGKITFEQEETTKSKSGSFDIECTYSGSIDNGVLTFSIVMTKVGSMPFVLTLNYISEPLTLAEKVAGTYKGDAEFMMMTQPIGSNKKQNITVTAVDKNHINATIDAVTYNTMAIPTFTIENIEIEELEDGTISMKPMQFTAKTETLDITGEIVSGTLKDGKANVKLNVKAGKMPMAITIVFTLKASEPLTLAEKIAGTYKGDAELMMMTQSLGSKEQNITVTAVDKNHINATIDAVTYNTMAIPTFTIENIEIEELEDGTISMKPMQFTAKTETLDITGEIVSGTLKDGKANVKLNVKAGKMPMAITIVFTLKASEPLTLAEKIAGTYKGDAELMMMTQSLGSKEQNITVTAADKNHINATIDAVTYNTMTIPAFTIENIEIEELEDGTISMKPMQFTAKTETMEIKGEIVSGTVKDGKANVKLNVQAGKMPMAITVVFTSK